MKISILSLLALSLTSCAPKEAPPAAAAVPAPTPASASPTLSELVLADMDRSVDACADFYQYSCGGWLARTELPSDKPSWTRSFSTIAESNRTFIKGMLEKAAADPTAGDADWTRMGNYYGACMDDAAVEAAGLTALEPWFARIDGVSDLKGVMGLAGELQMLHVTTFFNGEVEGDFLDPRLTILHVMQGGIGLPDRDYYLKDDADSKQLVADYESHVARMFELSGQPAEDAVAAGKAVVAFEVALATLQLPKAELRDPTKVYHKIDRAGLDKQVPGLDWAGWLAAMGRPDVTDINVENVDVLKSVADLMAKTDMSTLQSYMRYRLLADTASHLPKAFVDESFDFYGTKVFGQAENEPRWKRCVRSTDGAMGEVVGRYFIEERFAGNSKAIAVEMIQGVQDAFEARLPGLAWMDEETRARAIEKKNTLVNKIGYPDEWRDYSALDIVADDHLANVLTSRRFGADWMMAKVGNPADPNMWHMSPPTVNAYYHPLYNEMVFPAGILQPPFFDQAYPAAMNYGGIGMVMGHELTHGFDDSGRKFDPQGKMAEWWAPAASEAFEVQAKCVQDQFDGYEVAEGLPVNGQLTLGENIADLGGLKASFNAYRAYAAANPSAAAVDGLTDEQLYFVSFAQGWCNVSSPEFEKMLVLSNPHSPAEFRVNGPLSNLPEFHEVFGCAEGTPMRPTNQCEVW